MEDGPKPGSKEHGSDVEQLEEPEATTRTDEKKRGAAEASSFNIDAPAFEPRADAQGMEDIQDKLPLRHKQMLRGFYQAYNGEYVSYYVGTLKTYNVKNGYGFLECKQAKADWHCDVFVHKNNVPTPWNLGQPVEFAVQVNLKGQPQAYDCNWLPRLPQTSAVTPGTTPGLPGKGRGGYEAEPDGSPQAEAAKGEEETLSNEPRRLGTLKSYSSQHGYGFISCTETQQAYKRDVYLDKSQVGEAWQWNQLLEFSVSFNDRSQPQARNVNWEPVPLLSSSQAPPGAKRTYSAKTLDQLKRLLKLLHEKNNETAVVTAIDLQGGSGVTEGNQEDDVDYVFFVLDRLGEKEEALKSIKDFVKMLFVLMLARMLKTQKSKVRALTLIEWFQACTSMIQMSNESVQQHIQDVLKQINTHIIAAAKENEVLKDQVLSEKLDVAFRQLREKAKA